MLTQEKRQYERVDFRCPLELTPLPDGTTVSAHSTDLSFGGVGAFVAANLVVGQTVQIAFLLHDATGGAIQERVIGRVVWTRADADANRVGIQFLRTLDEAELPHLVQKLDRL